MPYALPPPTPTMQIRDDSPVVELRQYTLHPGKRDVLIDLFERELVEGQEAVGMRVLGQFRDADRPDRFVWLRGFPGLSSRAPSLKAFYGGPLWKARRDAANATMVDSDDVLLLRPVGARSGFALPASRPAVGAEGPPASLLVATIYLLVRKVDDDFVRFFESRVAPLMAETGAAPIASFRTEYAENDFPALPVRTGVNAFVWFSSFDGPGAHDEHLAGLARSRAWTEAVRPELERRLASAPQQLRLLPTARSLLGRAAPAAATPGPTGDAHDFDFLAGTWSIVNRRLRVRGAGSGDWDEFPATSRVSLHLGGVANVDEITFPTRGWSGMTLRVFDRERRRWSIYWVSGRTGVLHPPVTGGFAGERGEFHGEDRDEGRPVKVRFLWVKLGPDHAHWEQAFSFDGKTWETNWAMEFTRTGT